MRRRIFIDADADADDARQDRGVSWDHPVVTYQMYRNFQKIPRYKISRVYVSR